MAGKPRFHLHTTMPDHSKFSSRIHLRWCCLLHLITDGHSASLSLLLPFITADLGLSYAQSGLLKSASHGAISVAQIPAGLLAERIGSVWMLGLGTALQSAGYIALLLAVGYPLTLILILAAGIGGGVYHPVGTGLVSNLYPPERTGPPIGTLNFFGDVGKVIFPALAGVLVVRVGWQGSFASLGCIGLAVALLYLFFFRRELFPVREKRPRSNGGGRGSWKKGIRQPVQFSIYSTLGFLDETIRSGSFTFLGFLLIANGIEKGAIGWYLSLTFFGGACGKLLCGMPIARLGARRIIVITELLVVAGCLAIPSISSGWLLFVILPLFGFVLNGTSSVIYIGLVPTLEAEYRSRGYALYYTISFIAAAIAPYIFGLVADMFGLNAVYYGAALVLLLGLPLAIFLKEGGQG